MADLTTPAAVLRAVRELLAAPERWTQGAYWRNRHGVGLLSWQRGCATSFCLVGAMETIRPQASRGIFTAAWVIVEGLTGGIIAWNDTPGRTHADVLALLDRAIEEAERKGE